MEKFGIIGAMEIEVARLKADMKVMRTMIKAQMEFVEGELEGQQVVVVRSGIGKVNAAICTQMLIDDFGVTVVINTGIAGSLDASIDIGDIVISTDVVHHDMDVSIFGYAPGQVPQLDVFGFPTDETLASLANSVCSVVNPQIHVHRGRVVSGDQFIESKETKERLVSEFQGSCTEMEGAAIAQTAYLNGVKVLILRAISDKADDSATMDYLTFEKQAAENCVKLVEGLLAAV